MRLISTKPVLLFVLSVAFIGFLAISVSAAGCWDLDSQSNCESSADSFNCMWYEAGEGWCASDSGGCCEMKGCWLYDGDKTTCEAQTTLGCTWASNQFYENGWCYINPSTSYLSNGTSVSGEDIGCCSQPGCWDRNGINDTHCESEDFMEGICSWKTQAQDPYCTDSVGCCMMSFCDELTNESNCNYVASVGPPCSWSGSACVDQGFSGISGADSCIDSGGFWNATTSTCSMATFIGDVHCWFADYNENVCTNITGCSYCNATNVLNDTSACYSNTLGWCQGHEALWTNSGAVEVVQDIAGDSLACVDIQIQSACDCGPLPGCHWNESSESVGEYCISGVAQCNLNYEEIVYDQCADAPNKTECDVLKNSYFMPCVWNLTGTGLCDFDYISGGGFGDDKGTEDFEFNDLMDEQSCQFAGGIWNTVQIDAYGNSEAWCEFGFGVGFEQCNDSCWACEYQDNGTAWDTALSAELQCNESSAGGSSCSFVSFGGTQDGMDRWGWCDFPMAMDFFGGGNCEESCYDCFDSGMCNDSLASCTWVDDPMNWGPGWCDPAGVAQAMVCNSTNAVPCTGETNCDINGHNWTNEFLTDPITGIAIWVCIPNGTADSSIELCNIPGDEDANGLADCADDACIQYPSCGYGMSPVAGTASSSGGIMLPPGMEWDVCYQFDDTNQTACEAQVIVDGDSYINSTCRSNSSYADLPSHLNETQLCFYHVAPGGASASNWCDPIFEQQMMGGMDMGKPPTPIGEDVSGDADGLDHLDIIHVGIMDDPQTMDIGLPVFNITDWAGCYDQLSGEVNGTFYRYIDSDGDDTVGCTATDGTYDGFDYKLVLSVTFNGTDDEVQKAAYRCVDSTNNIWSPHGASLTFMDDACFASPPAESPDAGLFNGVNILMFEKSDFGVLTNDLRVLVATVGQDYNETNVTDEAGPFYYTPGAIDFKMEDCFGFVDMDGDGLTPSQDPDCMFIKNMGFIPFENCGDGIDNNADGVTDCDDPMCTYTPMCASGTAFNYDADSSDTTSPTVIFHAADSFNDSAFIKFDTNEPANGTVFFYLEDSNCQAINYTMYDVGDPYCSGDWCGYDDYKLWHDLPIDNYVNNYYAIGYELANGTTYYYKYKVCDPSDNCATSACSNFTTKAGVTTFYFDMNPPSGFTIKTPWATGGQTYSQQVDQTQTKDINITVECSASGYSMVLVGVDVKAAQDIDFTDFICSDSTNLIGMPSTKWDSLLFDLSVDWVEITWATGGDSAVIYHCDDDGTDCTAVTDYLDCIVGASSVTCSIPTTLGFSAYKVITTTDSTTIPVVTSGSGGGGVSVSANTTTNTTVSDDEEEDEDDEDETYAPSTGAAVANEKKFNLPSFENLNFSDEDKPIIYAVIVVIIIAIVGLFWWWKKQSKKPYRSSPASFSRPFSSQSKRRRLSSAMGSIRNSVSRRRPLSSYSSNSSLDSYGFNVKKK
jgi:hypothetical protein